MPVRNNQDELCLDDSERMKAWVEHYKGLLNVEFPWDEGALPDAPPVEGPPPPITDKMITKALAKMKSGKSAGPSGITLSATWVACSVLVVALWLLPLLDAGVPGVSLEKTFLCLRPSLCLSTWGVVCLALMYVVQFYMVWKLGPWLPTPFTGYVVTIALWSAGFVGSSHRMTHQCQARDMRPCRSASGASA